MATYQDIQDIANAQIPPGPFNTTADEPEFAKLVRSSSYILTENNPFTYEAIRQITPHIYWDAFIYLASKRKATIISKNENNPIDIAERGFLYLEDEVVAMLSPNGTGTDPNTQRYNMYGDGVRLYVAKLVAAHLIRNIPLNTSSIKQVDVGNTLEEQAYAGLARIVDISDVSFEGKKSSSTSSNEEENENISLFIAHDINKTTLPETAFNIPDPDVSPPTYVSPVTVENVQVVNGVEIPVGQIGFCYVYMTGQAYGADRDAILSTAQSTDSQAVSFRIEFAFQINNGDNIDDIITAISDNINAYTLEQLDNTVVSNILVAPKRGRTEIKNINVVKKLCYPETTNLPYRQANFKLCYRVNSLDFDVRRYSNKVDTELLSIGFYTVDSTLWANYNNNVITLPQLKNQATFSIPGLIFGYNESYRNLGAGTPFSILLNVNKGNTTPVSIQNTGANTNPQDQFGEAADLAQTDTFYFNVDNGFTGFSNNLLLRVSTNEYKSGNPTIIPVDLSNIQEAAGAPPNCVGEEVARRMVEAIFDYTRGTHANTNTKDNSNVLAVLLGEYNYEYLNINRSTGVIQDLNLRLPNDANVDPLDQEAYDRDRDAGRVQIVGFRYKDEEFKIIIEIIQIPSELYVATGNYLTRRTFWVKGKPRSISIETKVINTGGAVETTSEELNSVNASVSKSKAEVSSILQNVFDKKRLLRDSERGFPRSWSNQT